MANAPAGNESVIYPTGIVPMTIAELDDRWNALMERAKKTTAPKAELQDFYKVFASWVVGLSASTIKPTDIAQWADLSNTYEDRISDLEKRYPPRNLWAWAAGAAAVGAGFLYWRRRRQRA